MRPSELSFLTLWRIRVESVLAAAEACDWPAYVEAHGAIRGLQLLRSPQAQEQLVGLGLDVQPAAALRRGA
jgi:hypothetical protein